MKIFRVIKFSRFCSIRDIFLTIDDCKILESSWRLVYTNRYQDSQGSLAVVFDRTFTSGNVSEIHNGIMFDFYPGLPHMWQSRVLLRWLHFLQGKLSGGGEGSGGEKRLCDGLYIKCSTCYPLQPTMLSPST